MLISDLLMLIHHMPVESHSLLPRHTQAQAKQEKPSHTSKVVMVYRGLIFMATGEGSTLEKNGAFEKRDGGRMDCREWWDLDHSGQYYRTEILMMSHNLLRCSTYASKDTLIPLCNTMGTHFPLLRSGQVTLLKCLLDLDWGRVQVASCWPVIWQQQILLSTPSIHLSLFLCDTEWVWQAPGRPSLDLVTQFSAVCIIGVPPCSLVHLWAPQLTQPITLPAVNTCPAGPLALWCLCPYIIWPSMTQPAISSPCLLYCQRETWFVPGYHIAGSTQHLSREKRFRMRRDNDGAWLLVNYGHSMGHRFRNERAGDNPIIWDVWIMDFVYEAFFNTLHWMLRISSSQNL